MTARRSCRVRSRSTVCWVLVSSEAPSRLVTESRRSDSTRASSAWRPARASPIACSRPAVSAWRPARASPIARMWPAASACCRARSSRAGSCGGSVGRRSTTTASAVTAPSRITTRAASPARTRTMVSGVVLVRIALIPAVLPDSAAGRERTVNKLTTPDALITPPAMALRDIIILPDKRLRLVSEPVGKITAEIKKLVEDMFDTMYEAPGIGLAAIQVGVPKRVVTMDLSKKEGEKEPRVFINPEVVWSSDDPSIYEEGCLSIPEVHEDVERPAKVRVKYLDLDGKPHEEEAEGLYATCIQHEVDHLNGKLFIDRISKLKRDRIVKKFTK